MGNQQPLWLKPGGKLILRLYRKMEDVSRGLALCQELTPSAFGWKRYRPKTRKKPTWGEQIIRLNFTAYAGLSGLGTEALAALYKARQGRLSGGPVTDEV